MTTAPTTIIATAKKREAAISEVLKAHSEMIAKLAALKPHPIPTYPDPEDFIERGAHLRDVALAVDAYILALGRDCQSNVRGSFDLSLFVAPLTNALDGNAQFELESVAGELSDEVADGVA